MRISSKFCLILIMLIGNQPALSCLQDEILAGDDDDEEGGVIEYDEELEMKKQKMRAQQFEEEYKNKGRKKKPMKKRVFGPVWMADQESGAGAVMEVACEQLIRILKPYRAINLLQGGGQIPTQRSSPAPSPSEAAASAKVRLVVAS